MENIEDFLPITLDEIIRENRHIAGLRLADPAEIEHLRMENLQGTPKDMLDDWRIVAILFNGRPVGYRLIGIGRRTGRPVFASPISQISDSAALTDSGSLYGLGQHGEGEPPRDHLVWICAMLREMGIGDSFGVPPVVFDLIDSTVQRFDEVLKGLVERDGQG